MVRVRRMLLSVSVADVSSVLAVPSVPARWPNIDCEIRDAALSTFAAPPVLAGVERGSVQVTR